MNEEYVTASYIAARCGVTNSAVSNWLARGVLPKHMRPQTTASTGHTCIWLWTLGQADYIAAWDRQREEARAETRKKRAEKRKK